MAAAEKICEFSDEYEPTQMYKSKRNHVQVLSKHRKHFRGKNAVLYIFENGLQEVDKWGGSSEANLACINPNPTDADYDSGDAYWYIFKTPWGKGEYWDVFFENIKEYKQALKQSKQRLLMEYTYILHVPDVPGQVNGLYINYSTDLTAVKRRIRRMIGKNLKIVKKKGTWGAFYQDLKLVLK